MKRYTKGIHKVMDEEYGLADMFAQDGAFFDAARVLRGLADKVQKHAEDCKAFTDAYIADHNKRKGKSNGKRT